MIIKFSVENFRSIKDKKEFSFIASKNTENVENLIKLEEEEFDLLPSSIIYGANGAGKSNVLIALEVIRGLVEQSLRVQEGDKLFSYMPFKLFQDSKNEPSKFEIVFIVNKIKYFYGFSLNSEEIVEEFLYYYPKGRQSKIFERDNQEYTFTKEREEELSVLSKRTLKNRLFLSVAAEWKYEDIMIPFAYLKNEIILSTVPNGDNPNWFEYTANAINDNPKFKEIMLTIFSDLEMGIEDISSEFKKISVNDIPMPKEIKTLVNTEEIIQSDIFSYKSGLDKDGNKYVEKFNFVSEESRGTNKLFELLGPWIDILKKGKTLVVDELGTSLHPLLTRYLVEMFNNAETNTEGAQLLFTSHDTNMLDLNFFRRDQIWFVEKNEIGATDIYSLADIKNVRKDENIMKGYIKGKYSKIPFMKSGDLFGWK